MSRERSEMGNLVRRLYRDHKPVLDLLTERRSGSGFERAVQQLFGDNPARGKAVRIGNSAFICSGVDKSRVSFLPARWHEELDKTKSAWPGCDNWWAGYAFIAWVEVRAHDDGTTGFLKLNAEVGPISNPDVRTGIIEAIKLASLAEGLERIHFPAGTADEGRLYSRFLRKNSVAVNDIHDAADVESKFVRLVADFAPEFELVASVIPQFLRFSGASVSLPLTSR